MKRFIPGMLALASAHALPTDMPMEHVLVSVPLHKKVANTALPVTVLSGDTLRRQAGATIGETLSNSPGLANASLAPALANPLFEGRLAPVSPFCKTARAVPMRPILVQITPFP
jgi:iron complex outermembrane receptor protein